jgi:hypothetical protein
MELAQWVLPLDAGGFSSALSPADRQRLELEAGDVWDAGPTVHTVDLPLPVRLGLPQGAQIEAAAQSALLRLRPVSEAGEALLPDEPLPAVALLTELLIAVGRVVESLRLPLGHIVPMQGGEVEIALGPLVGQADAPLAHSLLLLVASTDILSRARGMGVGDVRVQLDGGPWRPVNAKLLRALQPH